MSNPTTIKRFLIMLSSFRDLERERLYQLLQKAEAYYCLKNHKGEYELGKVLEQFPQPFNLVGSYYQSPYLNSIGQKQKAHENLERVRQELKGMYAEKATLTLSGILEADQEYDKSLSLRLELVHTDSLVIATETALGLAALFGSQGEHERAIKQLEGVLPLIEKLGPSPLYYDILNSYAVELADTGKTGQAFQVITPVAVSPYTSFYPNWLETQKEIAEKLKRRSSVAIEKNIQNEEPTAKVLNFPTPKTEPAIQEAEPEAEPDFPYQKYLAEEFDLQSKIEDWIHGGTEPEDLGTLLIALAECEDPLEKELILEQMIDIVFPHTSDAEQAKSKWRKKILSKMKK